MREAFTLTSEDDGTGKRLENVRLVLHVLTPYNLPLSDNLKARFPRTLLPLLIDELVYYNATGHKPARHP